MNIDALLKAIHLPLQKGLAELSVSMLQYFGELSERASDVAERKELVECLKSFQDNKQKIDNFLMGTFREHLLELSGKDASKQKQANQALITADQLKLVEHNELEQQVALESLASKHLNKVSLELNKLNQRLNKAFDRGDIDDRLNPFAPALFCKSFGEAAQNVAGAIQYRLLLYKQFDKTLLSQLVIIITTANAELAKQGILPEVEVLHKTSARPGGSGGKARSTSVEQANVNDVSVVTPASGHAAPNSYVSPSGPSVTASMFSIEDPIIKQIYDLVSKDGYSVLQKLISDSSVGHSRISSEGVRDEQFQGKEELKDEELLDLLSNLQSQTAQAQAEFIPAGEDFKRVGIAQNVGQALQVRRESVGKDAALSKGASDVVNLVDMLFDFILSDDYLSADVKSVLSELQTPLTKVALLDPTFFSDNQHPARQLLNELSRAGMAVPRGQEALQDQTYKNISGTVKIIQTDFDKETTVFNEVLEDFSKKIEVQTKRSEMLEQRLREMEKGRAKSEHADELVSKLLDKMLASVPVSKEVEEFLGTAWRDVLMMTCLKFGSHSKQWSADTEITKKFMRSLLLAKKVRLDDKRMKIPMELLSLLKKALDRIAYDPLETKRLLSGLAKSYQLIANTSPEEIRIDLLNVVKPKAKVKKKKVTKLVDRPVQRVDGEHVAASDQANSAAEVEQVEVIEVVEVVEQPEPVSEEELNEKLKNIDALVLQEIEREDEEEVSDEDEFVAGNPWYDMASQLPIGAWMELKQEGSDVLLRCKLVANIKTLGKLIFANKAGVKVADKKVVEIAEALKKLEARVINDNMIFDQALESVIVNLRKKT